MEVAGIGSREGEGEAGRMEAWGGAGEVRAPGKEAGRQVVYQWKFLSHSRPELPVWVT